MLMVVIWAAASFNFYLLIFIANTFEQGYVTGLFIAIADVVSYAISGLLVEKTSTKRTIFVSYSIATIGGIIILVYGLKHQESAMFPILFFISRFGISCAFNALYVGNNRIFP